MQRPASARSQLLAAAGIVLAAMLLPAVACPGEPATEDGKEIAGAPGDARAARYLDVLNSGDPEVIREYITEHCEPAFLKAIPMSIHISLNMGPYYESAGLGYDLFGVGDSGEKALSAVVRNRLTGAWLDLRVPLAENPPHRIAGFPRLEPTSAPADVESPGRLSDEDIVDRLETCMAKLIGADEFSGAVLLAKDGKPLFHKAYGLASKSYGAPNRLDTKFNIASLGKMFTAVAAAQLAEKGKLSLQDPVSKYLGEDWLKSEFAEKIRIQHLLTHTSGLGNYFRKLYAQPSPMVFRGLEDYRDLVAYEVPAFEPGTGWSYSNTGFLLLGAVIEKAAGKSYFDYVREHIFEPSGMTNSDAYERDRPVENRATGYMKERTDEGVEWMNNNCTRAVKGGPSGGSYSTVEDLLKFDTALRTHKLLSPEYTGMVLSAKPEIHSPFYGYGFDVSEGAAGRIAEHGGDGLGISCSFRMYLDSGYTVAVLSNYNVPAAGIVDSVIHQLIIVR